MHKIISRFSGSKLLVAGLLVGGSLGTFGYAAATSSPSTTVFYACLNVKAGTMNSINTTGAPKCGKGNVNTRWNTSGPKGDAGIPGSKGDAGATGAQGPKGDIGSTGPQGFGSLAVASESVPPYVYGCTTSGSGWCRTAIGASISLFLPEGKYLVMSGCTSLGMNCKDINAVAIPYSSGGIQMRVSVVTSPVGGETLTNSYSSAWQGWDPSNVSPGSIYIQATPLSN